MSNYEHIFESAIDHLKSGKDFDDFQANKAVLNNINYEFDFIDGYTDRMDAKRVLLDSIWSIAQYVSCYYIESEKDCNTCAWQKAPECFCDICVYGPKTKDCYLPN